MDQSCQFKQFFLDGKPLDGVYQCENPSCKRLVKGLPEYSVKCRSKKRTFVVVPCIYLGEALYKEDCKCGGKPVELFKCALFGQCTIHNVLNGGACCSTCNSYVGSNLPAPSPTVNDT